MAYRWVQINNCANFPARDGAGLLSYKDKLYLIGGWDSRNKNYFPKSCSNDVWVSEDGRDWDLIKPQTFRDDKFNVKKDWEGRHTAGYVIMNDEMYIVGGDINQGHYQADVWKSRDGMNWELVCSKVPWGPRCLHYTFILKNEMYILGGQTMPDFVHSKVPTVHYNDVWKSVDGQNWDCILNNANWYPRGMIGSKAVLNDRVYLIGGGTYDTHDYPDRKYYRDVWSSDNGIDWKCHTKKAPWSPRSYHEVAVFDNKLWVLEGHHMKTKNKKDVWFSGDGVDWTELPDTPWDARHAASVTVHQECLWVIAGNNMKSDIWKLEKV